MYELISEPYFLPVISYLYVWEISLAISYLIVMNSIKKIGKVSRLYKINGTGSYSMCQVIEEYIKFKLRSGIPFNSIYRIGQKFISNHPSGVSIASYKGAKPYSFNFKGRNYYVTTQLRDNKPTDNFRKFRTTVSKNEPAFIITP